MNVSPKQIIGLTEHVGVRSTAKKRGKRVLARIDTGAVMSSIDVSLAASLGLGPIKRMKKVKNANGVTERAVVDCVFVIKGHEQVTEVTLADRKHLKYRILIGQNILQKTDLIINPRKQARKKT